MLHHRIRTAHTEPDFGPVACDTLMCWHFLAVARHENQEVEFLWQWQTASLDELDVFGYNRLLQEDWDRGAVCIWQVAESARVVSGEGSVWC